MKLNRYILLLLLVWASALAFSEVPVRYVKTTADGGSYSNNGLSWETAKDKVQDAINDLHEYMEDHSLTSGEVYIAAGTYVPTESTEPSGGSLLTTSFKIYAGIHVYGGFNPDSLESKPGDRIMANGKKCSENWADQSGIGTTSGTEIASQWDFKYKTILSGNHTTTPPTFVFDSIRGRYNTAYPASSFHVVWFATNNKFVTGNDSTEGHYRPLEFPASLDGCVISSGAASTRNTQTREHTAYGGGVYMVGNSSMRGCTVERCIATMRGGGIYCDGGGDVDFCLIKSCQATGIGVLEGYGGGVCIDYDGSCNHSHIAGCAARCGGGLLISHIPEEYPIAQRVSEHILPRDTAEVSNYFPFSSACVINNNTANAEGGGIYLAEGGTINHATVTGNNCCGPDVTYYGRRHGRTGGIYVRNCGMIFNSVFWGNRCDANNDIQFASVRQTIKTGYETLCYHSAFMNHDISDWTGVRKEMVYALEKQNMPVNGTLGNHPCFFSPTVNPEDWSQYDPSSGLYGAGVFQHLYPVQYPGPRIWHLTSYSALDQKGVQANETVRDASPWLLHAHTDYGVVSNPYEPISTLGALVRRPDPLVYALIAPQGYEGRQGGDPIPTLFIDPNRKGVYDESGHFVPQSKEGNSWDTPIKDFGEALSYFRQYLVDAPGGNHHYLIPNLDNDGKPTGDSTAYDYVQFLVKEGTITTVGHGNYLDRNVRTAAIRVDSHMRLYGGYSSKLEGTDTSGRNPRDYRTIISANITGVDGAAGYQNNSAHVIAMVNVEHTIVDGFTLQGANTHDVYLSGSAQAGGGLLINNHSTDSTKRIHMVGNQLRNCVIANCTSPKGAAVYVNGEFSNADGELSYAELLMQNCVIRNNTADFYKNDKDSLIEHGIITANGRAYIHIEHCTVANNVGYPFKADSKTTDGDLPIHCKHPEHIGTIFHGYIRVDNSLIFCNGDSVLDNRGDLGKVAKVMSVNADGQDYVFGKWNMFDADLRLHELDIHQPRGFFANGYTVPITDHFMPDGVASHFTDDIRGVPADSLSRDNKAIFTRVNNDRNYPTFVNPARNVGHSTTGDKPLYGGSVAYNPLTTNPCVNAAHPDDYTPDLDNYDRSDNLHRDRGGAPDVGAIENSDLPAAGAVIYVTPEGAGKRDGSSWDNAIAGNTVYMLSSVAGPEVASTDSIDEANSARLVNKSTGTPVLTTDSVYNGGWGRVWFTNKTTGASTTTTITKTWTTEKNVYDNGAREGEEEIIQDDVYSENSDTESTPGSTPGEFVPYYYYDPRYPYGEISGASRTFWRANPYSGTSGSYSTMETFIAGCNDNGWISNTRAERYVGGLQYAVEKASAANKTYHRDSVQVWVGAGHYTDYKGFVMRDSVTVLGGFPAGKFAAPALSERQALMSDVINIPKSKPAASFNAVDYETILQVSEVNPKNSNTEINTDAVKYWDDDYSLLEETQTTQYEYKSRTIIHHYEYFEEEHVGEDIQNEHMQYADMNKAGGGNVATQKSTSYSEDNDTVLVTLGKEGDLDCWHVSYPNKENFVVYVETNANATNKKRDIYDPSTNVKIPAPNTYTGNWIFLGNGSMAGLNLWQEMRNMPAGRYRMSFDLGGEYKNKIYANDPLNIFVCVVDGNGVGISDTISLKSRTNNKDNNRGSAYRFTFDFNLLSAGNAVFKLFVGDGNKNTKANNPTYGTDTGVDPDEIPCLYVNKEDKNICPTKEEDKWGSYNPNAREFWLSNIHIKSVISAGTYGLINTDDNTAEKGDVPHEDPVITETNTYTVQNHRTTLRKRVLTMPDVCVPTYGGGGIGNPVIMDASFGDKLPHTDRVWGPTKEQRTASTETKQEDSHYVEYNEATWDGFTIRHGFLFNEAMAHGGGAGVNMYEGAHLRNCIVSNNFSGSRNMKGGGMFCDGATSTIEGCFVLNNTSTQGTEPSDKHAQNQIFAGGMFMYEGTCFNSLFANNYSWGSAGGLGFCVGRFFNNTIAYNTATLEEGGQISGGAISLATSSNPNLFVANTIIFGNNGVAIRDRGAGYQKVNPFLYCYLQSEKAQSDATTTRNVINWSSSATSNYGTGNTFLNGIEPSADNTPFAADFDESGNYVAGRAASLNDFRLRVDVPCVNKGTEEFAGEFYTALRHKGKTDSEIRNSFVYKSVEAAVLPDNDVAFAKRVQDCQIDMGAYEFNAAYNIKPDTTTHPGRAIFYIAYDSPGGDASACSPENAACGQKLQLILDAAGRYRYNLMKRTYTLPLPAEPIARQPDSTWTVEVWMEGDSIDANTTNDYRLYYTPTRSTKHSVPGYNDNTLDYSFIVPHGVQVKGGFKPGYGDRDPLTYRTVLSGKITSSTGAEGQTFHVVTFTNDLFDMNEELYTVTDGDDKKQITNQLDTVLTLEKHRAVIDGLFIEDGYANSPDHEDQIGAGAVVTGYAHVRNCVIMNNKAIEKGGGLYLKPNALVSGTIIKSNSAKTGGGIYIETPDMSLSDSARNASLAHVFSSTICENSATASAGGMWFDNTYARVNSTVLWHNMASDNANVSGSFTRSDEKTEYPFNFCAVESRRLEGQGNLELSPTETEGVRWDRKDPFDAILYYPIEMSSTLSRAGMTYNEWRKTRETYPTLDTVDIAGVHRAQWTADGSKRGFFWGTDTLVTKNNDMIEIGARAINKSFAINVDKKYVMRRLFVMHTDLIDSEAARKLQDNTATDSVSQMYRQMGSCILNPFHRPGDAFDYIIAARKSDPVKYCNTVFEVFIEAGTYYPYHNAYGEQDEVRNNTFLVPEGIYVIGGVDSRPADHKYGQHGYHDQFTADSISANGATTVEIPGTGYSINVAPLDSIRQRGRHRPMRDNNMNSVIEPWELERQTILSGNAVSGEAFTHVYHVITMHADSTKVGPQPRMFYRVNPEYGKTEDKMFLLSDTICRTDTANFSKECDLSILGRTTEFDGITITGGYANHLDPNDTLMHHYVKKTYFRGGGIFVDGLWTDKLNDASLPNMTEPAHYNIPIVVENCLFTDNMAGNGGGLYSNGAIYMYGCHFTQNYSQGPMTALDQRFIPWTAGGCIATNAVCDVSNTLFANNEARRGLYPINVKGADSIPDADARQGFGGVLSVAAQSQMRVVNCHFMKNKAVAYSSIYNFLANNRYSTSDSMQIAINTIFWGNEVFDLPNGKLSDLPSVITPPKASEDAFALKYRGSRAGVFHYDPTKWTKYERLFHEYDSLYHKHVEDEGNPFAEEVIQKLDTLRALGDSIEGLYFCSYRPGYGPSGMKPTSEGYLLTQAEQRAFTDPRSKNVRTKTDAQKDVIENLDSLFTYVHGNNNTLINPVNTATDGPNFRQPSFVAGVDGYMQNADWLLARMNLTTDQGWGYLKQTVTRGTAYWLTRYTGARHFDTESEARIAAMEELHIDEDTLTRWSVFPVSGLPVANFDNPEDQPVPGALYNFYARRFGTFMSDVNAPLPLGDQPYMTYTRATSTSETAGVMNRISRNPRMGETEVYIDVGIYEYQYVTIEVGGQDIDTMWVATKSKPGAQEDGLSWATPTTNLQYAIDKLMSSHNNHDKYICLLGDEEGSYSPSKVIDNRLAFIITSNTMEPMMPDSALADYNYCVKSLNFLGGYSYDVPDAPRDPVKNPVVFEMPNGNKSQLNQLFIVEDMTRQQLQVNWNGESLARDNVAIPITFDGLTFINPHSEKDRRSDDPNFGGFLSRKGGAAIYYRWQRSYEGEGQSNLEPNMDHALYADSVEIDGQIVKLPKLTISNCVFMDNGSRVPTADSARSPAVRIDHGGGSSLIVNSVFHSNAGNPVFAETYVLPERPNNLAAVPNDVVIMNSTFALNDGHIVLKSANSEVHNSLLWLNDLMKDTTVQLVMGGDQWDKTNNREKEGIANRMTHNAVWGCFMQPEKDTFGNDSLVTDNKDIIGGPGFLNPYVTATTSAQRRERNFRLNPSTMTIEKADSSIYKSRVFYRVYPDTSVTTQDKYWRRPNGFKSTYITALANDSDLACKPRLSGEGMERGAYECLVELQRVLYVAPTYTGEGDGSTWGTPFRGDQLQNAIDAAAVYTYLYPEKSRDGRRAYVIVKSSTDNVPLQHIVARDGVTVIGSVPNTFNDEAVADGTGDEKAITDNECHRYINYVRAYVPGVAAATPTRISSIHVISDKFNTGFLMEGFVITNPGTELHASPIILDNDSVTLRNCLITNNTVRDVPLADVKHGLLYNCLFYENNADTIVKIGANGLALNNTIVADTAVALDSTSTGYRAGAAQNNIALHVSEATCFAPYMTDKNPYTLPEYLRNKPQLSYQLHERSAMINTGTDMNALPDLFNTFIADSAIHFDLDRDILGNPRQIGAKVDMGALETWHVAPKTGVEITALTNRQGHATVEPAATQQRTAYLTNYGGNKYPHPGSVVYLMDSAVMSMQYEEPDDFQDFNNNDIILKPGYMLLKPGASFYGNGHEAQFQYLAAEKRFVNQRYAMTAMPFNYDTANIVFTTYNDAKDSLAMEHSPLSFKTYQYSGAARSAKDYTFQTENSTLWLPVDTANRTATDGYLMDFGRTVADTVLRFTAFAPEQNRYVYTESGEVDKMVHLAQYDNREAGTGSNLNFTRQEDMGWNMKGLPWLVSDYRTDTLLEEEGYQRQMFIPHVLYLMNGAGVYEQLDGDKIYSARSWDRGTTLSMGDAFFTQTATTKDKETVYFHLPYYGKNSKVSRPLLAIRGDRDASADILTIMPDPEASKTVNYAFGRDAIKWLSADNSVQMYLLDSKRTSRISLLASAPVEVDIPLGIYVPANSQALTANSQYTFTLPDKEAFDGYEYVWLIDYKQNHFTNLLTEDYSVLLEPGEHNNRFAVRIGGFPKTDDKGGRQYVVFSSDGTLYVRGLVAGDRITLYAPSGQLITHATATTAEWSMPLTYQTGYVVKVNDKAYKVMNR